MGAIDLFPEPFPREFDVASIADIQRQIFIENMVVASIAVFALIILCAGFFAFRKPVMRQRIIQYSRHTAGVILLVLTYGIPIALAKKVGFYVFRSDGVEGVLGTAAVIAGIYFVVMPWQRAEDAAIKRGEAIPTLALIPLMKRYLYAGFILGCVGALTRW